MAAKNVFGGIDIESTKTVPKNYVCDAAYQKLIIHRQSALAEPNQVVRLLNAESCNKAAGMFSVLPDLNLIVATQGYFIRRKATTFGSQVSS